jgi:hypothetical protein
MTRHPREIAREIRNAPTHRAVSIAEDDALRARVADLEAKLAASEAKCAEAVSNYHEMVRKVAENRLDGYRELGARASAAENERDDMRRQLATERAARAEAERVAVWTGKRARVWMTSIEYQVEGWHRSRNTMAHDGTDESIYRALRRAEAEAKADHG